jgi:hypothetical protein
MTAAPGGAPARILSQLPVPVAVAPRPVQDKEAAS